MFTAHLAGSCSDEDIYIECLAACYECADACNACAEACLTEKEFENQEEAIRLNLDCSDVCLATAEAARRRIARNKRLFATQVHACGEICRNCADECRKHEGAIMHCRVCAEACERCTRACQVLLALMA